MPFNMDNTNEIYILCDFCGNQIAVTNNNMDIMCHTCGNDICLKYIDMMFVKILLFTRGLCHQRQDC